MVAECWSGSVQVDPAWSVGFDTGPVAFNGV